MAVSASETVKLSLEEVHALVMRVLGAHGADEPNARAVADNMTAAERDGSASHGVFRLPGHVKLLDAGVVNGCAVPELTQPMPTVLRVAGDNGFAPRAQAVGLGPLAEAATAHGMAALALTRVMHYAALWPEVEALAEQGLAAMAFTSSPPCVVPAGGRMPVFGTNPMAFAWPRPDAPPLVWDQASASMARGELMIHARDGHAVPETAGIDAHGNPSSDPKAILEGGAQLAFGGYKGAAVALMVDLLAGPLIGEATSIEAGRDKRVPGPQLGGELILAVSPDALGARHDGAEELFAAISSQPGARLPADRRRANRARIAAEGAAIPAALHAEIVALGG